MTRVFSEILGQYVEVPDNPRRIVSLSPAVTETLYLLGLEENIAGVSFFCNKPPEAKKKPRVGSYYNVNYKKLSELNPDLILVTTGAQRKTMEELVGKGYTVYPVPLPVSLHGILENTIVIGHVTNTTRRARMLARDLASRLALLQGQAPSARVYYEIWLGGTVSAGSFSYIVDALNYIGLETCYDDEREPWIINPDPQTVSECNPDYFIYEIPPYTEKVLNLIEKSLKERGLDKLPTVKENGVLLLPPDSLAHYGPSIVDALENLILALRGKTPRDERVRWHRIQ